MLINPTARGTTSSRDLVDLLDECHQRIRRFAALACEIARRGDAPANQVIQACGDVARYFGKALPLHVADEEESLEPRLYGLTAETDRALDAMTTQHGQHTAGFERLFHALDEVRRDPGSERARAQLAAAAGPLRLELEEHLALEERVIFPAIRRLLPRETQALVLDELRRRRAPGAGS